MKTGMKKLSMVLILAFCLAIAGCGGSSAGDQSDARTESETDGDAARQAPQASDSGLADGFYSAIFETDSSMFSVNETKEGRGELTVKDGAMTIHITLGSKNILNLYPGLAEDAQKEGAPLLEPTVDTVTYSDGMTEEVYGFDVPVPYLDEEFDLALIGKKGKWYDHKVSVSDPQPIDGDSQSIGGDSGREASAGLADGVYEFDIDFEGGSGKSRILSPVKVSVEDGKMTAALQWNSPNYDYMVADGVKYLPVNADGDSLFEIPVPSLDAEWHVIGDTVAMSEPHEIEYTITFHSASGSPSGDGSTGASTGDGSTGEFTGDVAYSGEDGGRLAPAPEVLAGMAHTDSMELRYAENFSVDYYEGGYTLLSETDGARILLVPEDGRAPDGIDEDIIVLRRPVENLYLAASAVMDMFDAIGAVDAVTLSGQEEDGWYIESARQAMAAGDMLYAGKYDKPDYELILSKKCPLAIENRMIGHAPEVIGMLEDFGIPVIIEYSSSESHPFGRAEWVKFFGALTGRETAADEEFARQAAILDEVAADEATGKTVAFFYITSNGMVQVRLSNDYVPEIIRLAGGEYIFDDLGDEDSARSTMNMQVEEFYNGARDADFIIYNGSIDGGVSSMADLLEKCPLLSDFKAVREGNAWCAKTDMYQQSMSIGAMIGDIHGILAGRGEDGMEFLYRLK